MLRILNFWSSKEIFKKVKNVLEKEPVELLSELEEMYSVVLFVAGNNDDHQFDRDSRKVFYGENKKKVSIVAGRW